MTWLKVRNERGDIRGLFIQTEEDLKANLRDGETVITSDVENGEASPPMPSEAQ